MSLSSRRKVLIAAGAVTFLAIACNSVWLVRLTELMQAAAGLPEEIRLAGEEGLLDNSSPVGPNPYEKVLKPFLSSGSTGPGQVASTAGELLLDGPLPPDKESAAREALRRLKPSLNAARTLSSQELPPIWRTGSVPDCRAFGNLVFALVARGMLTGDDSITSASELLARLKQSSDIYDLASEASIEHVLLAAAPKFPRATQRSMLQALGARPRSRQILIAQLGRRRDSLRRYWEQGSIWHWLPFAKAANETRVIQQWRQLGRAVPNDDVPLTELLSLINHLPPLPKGWSYEYMREYGDMTHPFAQLKSNDDERLKLLRGLEGTRNP